VPELALAALAIAVPTAVLAGRLVPKRTAGLRRRRGGQPGAAVRESVGARSRADVREELQEPPVSVAELPPGVSARVEELGSGPELLEGLPETLTLGQRIAVTSCGPQAVVVRAGRHSWRLPRTSAERLLISPVDKTLRRLSALKLGETGEIEGLSSDCAGLARRRLLDLGLTPGTPVTVVLDNTFGDPRGFRVRSTTVALRRRQTDHVWVRSSIRRNKAAGSA